ADPDLAARYGTLNEQYFAGALPAVPVIWEPRLGEVGPLIAEGYTLEGLTSGAGLIALNPDLAANPKNLQRALCHEMVHEYLFSVGDSVTNHGPAFQAILLRLSEAGAFEGIAATSEAKASLRMELRAESARLDAERQSLDRGAAEIDAERVR